MAGQPPRHQSRLPVYIAVSLLTVFTLIFIIEFADLSETSSGADVLTPETYLDIVEPLLVNACPANGPALLQKYGCLECHGNNGLAPSYDNLAVVAGERRPPLTAAAYIYESIIYPGAYRVEGYESVYMPATYHNTIPDDELGDIIAYLVSSNIQQP